MVVQLLMVQVLCGWLLSSGQDTQEGSPRIVVACRLAQAMYTLAHHPRMRRSRSALLRIAPNTTYSGQVFNHVAAASTCVLLFTHPGSACSWMNCFLYLNAAYPEQGTGGTMSFGKDSQLIGRT